MVPGYIWHMPECPFGKVFIRFNGAAVAWRLRYNLIFWHFYDIGLLPE
jgi:hypothetical protein